MRTLIAFCFLLVFPALLFSQASVRTEAASNRYKNYSAATTGDTLFTKAAAVNGSAIPTANTGVSGYIERLVVGTAVASDTLILKNGLGTVLQVILASSGQLPVSIEVGARLDTSLVYVQKKASNVSVIYRTGY